MDDHRQSSALGGPGIMLLSAAIFGFFGFYYVQGSTLNASGQLVPSWFLVKWTLRGAAILFAIAAGLTVVRPWSGNLLYSVCGLLSAALFVVILVVDYLDKQHAAPIPPVLLAIFAAWNGYGAWTELRAVLRVKRPR